MKKIISLAISASMIFSMLLPFCVNAHDGGNTVLEWFFVDECGRNANGGYRTEVRNSKYDSTNDNNVYVHGVSPSKDLSGESMGIPETKKIRRMTNKSDIFNAKKVTLEDGTEKAWFAWIQNLVNSGLTARFFDAEPYKDTAMLVLKLRADINDKSSLDNYYIILGDTTAKSGYGENLVGVRLSDYYTDDDEGAFKLIRVPLSDFEVKEDKFNACADSSAGLHELNFSSIRSMGIAWEGTEPTGTDTIYMYDVRILNVLAPESVSNDALSDSVLINWSASESDDISGYEIYRNGEYIESVDEYTLSYTDTDVEVDNTYEYTVRALDKFGGISPHSEITTAYTNPMEPPKNFLAEPVEDELAVRLTWDTVENDSVDYISVLRDGEEIARVSSDKTEYIDTNGIENNKTYSYRAVSIGKYGADSNPTSEYSVLASYIVTPADYTVTQDGTDVIMSWEPVKNAVCYNIYSDGVLKDSVIQNEYILDNLEPDTCTEVYVTAENKDGRNSIPTHKAVIVTKNEESNAVKTIFSGSCSDGFVIETGSDGECNIEFNENFNLLNTSACAALTFEHGGVEPEVIFKGDMDLTALSKDAYISFVLMLPSGSDIDNIYISFLNDYSIFSKNTSLRSSVAVKDYITYNENGFCYVKIPFMDFPKNGTNTVSTQEVSAPMDWSAVTGLSFFRDKTEVSSDSEFFLNELEIRELPSEEEQVLALSAESQTVNKGAVASVDAVMECYPEITVSELILQVDYDYDILSVNNILFPDYLNDAVADLSEKGKIKITAASEDGILLSDKNLCTLKFDTLSNGTADVEISVDLTDKDGNRFSDLKATANITVKNSQSSSGKTSSSTGGSRASGSSKTSSVPQNTSDVSESFVDLENVSWAKEAISYLFEKKVVNGYEDNTFRPDSVILREEFAAMLVKAFGIYDKNAQCNFDDVTEQDWYSKYVASAAMRGIVNGVSDTSFGAGSCITRQDMAVMICRAADSLNIITDKPSVEVQFEDADRIAGYAVSSVQRLANYGIVNGMGNNKFEPAGNVSRAMAAKVIYEVLQMK